MLIVGTLTVRRAGVDELKIVMDLLHTRIAWLRARSSDQWSTWPAWPAKLTRALGAGHVWLLLEQDLPIGTVSADQNADLDFWTPQERGQSATYLAKLAVHPDRAGRGYGALLLDVISTAAARQGAALLRLDA